MSQLNLVLEKLIEMDKRFTERFDQIDRRLDHLESRMDGLEYCMDKLDAKLTMVHDQVVRNSEAIEKGVKKSDLKNIVNSLLN